MKGDARRDRNSKIHKMLVIDSRKERVCKFLKIKAKDFMGNKRAVNLVYRDSKNKMDSILNET